MRNNFEPNKIIRQILDQLPDDYIKIQQDIKKNLNAILQSKLSKLEIVTREDFDVQSQLLARTRSIVDELGGKIKNLEQDR